MIADSIVYVPDVVNTIEFYKMHSDQKFLIFMIIKCTDQ